MTFRLSPRSVIRLDRVHPGLVRVVKRAIELTTIDFMVIEGVRSREAMCANYGKGRTAAECRAVGVPERFALPGASKVTWLRDPFASKHGIQADGYGHAVDLGPLVDGAIPWNDPKAFDAVARAMMEAAGEIGVHLRWGADWDHDGKPRERGETDSPHFEITP